MVSSSLTIVSFATDQREVLKKVFLTGSLANPSDARVKEETNMTIWKGKPYVIEAGIVDWRWPCKWMKIIYVGSGVGETKHELRVMNAKIMRIKEPLQKKVVWGEEVKGARRVFSLSCPSMLSIH